MTRYVVDASVWVGAMAFGDRWHTDSVTFFEEALRREDDLLVPALALVEIPCAIRRRTGSAEAGRAAYDALLRHPSLIVQAMDTELLFRSVALGLEFCLRGADAIYAAAAERTGATLVTWDREILDRVAGSLEPPY